MGRSNNLLCKPPLSAFASNIVSNAFVRRRKNIPQDARSSRTHPAIGAELCCGAQSGSAFCPSKNFKVHAERVVGMVELRRAIRRLRRCAVNNEMGGRPLARSLRTPLLLCRNLRVESNVRRRSMSSVCSASSAACARSRICRPSESSATPCSLRRQRHRHGLIRRKD